MIELEDAVAKVTRQMQQQTKTERVPLMEAFGRILAQDVVAPISVPNFARAGMDGYAVFAEDIADVTASKAISLVVVSTIFAGDDATLIKAQHGTAVRIMTGAAIPEGYNAVVKQEWTDCGNQIVTIHRNISVGENYAPIGEDMLKGQTIFKKHTYLSADGLGVLASLGLIEIEVLQPIRVGLISTGNELVQPGEDLAPSQIYNSTLFTLSAYIEQSGGKIIFRQICRDDVQQFSEIIEEYAEQVDLFITTGGVSVGAKDFIPQAVKNLDGEEIFHFVNIKPGTPIMASLCRNKLMLSLSGNPFAALVNFHLFYWEILSRFSNNTHFKLEKQQLVLESGNMMPHKMRRFIRAKLNATGVLIDIEGHHSSIIHNTVEHNCLVEQPVGEALHSGDLVNVYKIQKKF